MSSIQTREVLAELFLKAAHEYEEKLTDEDIMESTPQATQRAITLESLSLVPRLRPDIHVYNELLLQHKKKDDPRIIQAVPDNMVVVYPGPLEVEGSYDIPLQPVGPMLVMEYVSKSSRRKDHEVNGPKYQELKIPYYLMFHPEIQELALFRLEEERYASVVPNDQGRYPIPDLEIEVAVLDDWMRFWFRGGLLPLPPELQDELERAQAELHRARDAQRQAEEARRKAEERQRKAEESQRKAVEGRRKAEEGLRKEEEARRVAEESRRKAEESRQQLAEDLRKTADALGKAEQGRLADRQRIEELERLLAQMQKKSAEE